MFKLNTYTNLGVKIVGKSETHGNKHRNNPMYLYVLWKETCGYMTKGQYAIAYYEIKDLYSIYKSLLKSTLKILYLTYKKHLWASDSLSTQKYM